MKHLQVLKKRVRAFPIECLLFRTEKNWSTRRKISRSKGFEPGHIEPLKNR